MTEVIAGVLLTTALSAVAWLLYNAATNPEFYEDMIEPIISRAGFALWCVAAGVLLARWRPAAELLPWVFGSACGLSILGLTLMLLAQRSRETKRQRRSHEEQ